jgi:FkbM family methyltransferase
MWPLKLIKLYTFNSPIRKGKYRLALLALKLCGGLPEEVVVKTTDGRKLFINPSSFTYRFVYFLGEYERTVTNIIRQIIKSDDVCFDVGANIGWYTTLLMRLTGPKTDNQVHSFEPVPEAFEKLKRNVALNDDKPNAQLNRLSLGESSGKVELHVFEGLPEGHSSISDLGRTDYKTVQCPMVTLDSYLKEKNIERVDFVKVDIEGAELQFLKGATSLFRQNAPPILLIEMALGTSKPFGYTPNDIILFIREHADYDFYAIDEMTETLKRIDGFAPDDKGAYVLCVPAGRHEERLAKLDIRR